MTLLVIGPFQGEVPRSETHLLPDGAASDTLNVDTRTGSIKPLAGPGSVSAVAIAVKSLYTETGLTFFTWPTDVDACKSNVIGDIYQRVYFTDGSGFYGTTGNQMSATGGPPTTAWKQGVPAPVISLLAISNATAWPDGITTAASFFYESGGLKYQETPESGIAFTNTGAGTPKEVGRSYRFTPPARDSGIIGDGTGVSLLATGYSAVSFNPAPSQVFAFDAPEVITIVSASQIKTQSQGIVNALIVATQNIYNPSADSPPGVTIINVADAWNSSVDSGKTPAGAIPVLQIIGKKGTETVFTLYSEGSTFVRADQPAKIIINQSTVATNYDATIEWGANAVLGKSVAKKTSAYVATFVNTYLEESAPSLPLIITTDYLQTILIAWTAPSLTGYLQPTRLRIYETVTGSRDTAYHLSVENQSIGSPVTNGVVAVANALATVGSTLETIGWDVPPTGLAGLQVLPFGSYVAFRANELYFTEQYRPHTMPAKYVMVFPNAIKSIMQSAHGLIVVTTAQGYVVNGMSPDSMQRTELPVRCSITSKRAITEFGSAAWFASEDGIVMIQGSTATLTPWQRLFTRELWRSRYGGPGLLPDTTELADLTLASNDGYLVGLFPQRNGFLVRLDENVGEFIQHSIVANGTFILPQTDGLYLGTNTGIQQFGAGQVLRGIWSSKQYTVAKPLNFGCIEFCGTGAVAYIVYGDGVQRASGYITMTEAGAMQRLPSGYKAQRWTVSIAPSGAVKINSIRLAEIPAELAGV